MDEQLMTKFIQGTCSDSEKLIFLEWLHQSDENRKLFYQTKALWNHRNLKHFETEELLSHAVFTLNQNIDAVERRRKKISYLHFAKYAAIVMLALSIPILFYTLQKHQNIDSNLITITVTQTDSSKAVTLSDGSRIWLNSNSTLIYPAKFNGGERNVTFSGEAYFEIKHDSLHPFKVQTKNLQVKVLGTSFNVRAYPSERKVETTLVKGSVSIQNNQGDHLALLAPGQMAEFDKTSRYLSVKEVDTDLYTSWRYGLIVFTNVTLDEITSKIAELYHVHFVFKTAKDNHMAYNFNFRKSQSIHKVMEMLCFIAPINYQIQEEGIVITEKIEK
jgi:transmembrane sensor